MARHTDPATVPGHARPPGARFGRGARKPDPVEERAQSRDRGSAVAGSPCRAPSRHRLRSSVALASLLLSLAALSADGYAVRAAEDEPPPGVEQILPRGQIAAVVEPRFVSVSEANIPDDAWVLGVVVEGSPRAYSLNLLNRHEVVNDRSGSTDFAAVW